MKPPPTDERTTPGMAKPLPAALVWFPVVAVPAFGFFLALRDTHAFTYVLLMENSVVEQATFVAFMTATVLSLKHAWRLARRSAPALQSRFFAVLGVLSFLGGMEEIAWGQSWLAFPTPWGLRDVNEQGELTIHNMPGIQDLNAFLLMAFGIAAMMAIRAGRNPRWRPIAASPVLTSYAAVIAVTGLACLIVDIFYIERTFDLLVGMLSEVVELLMGMFLALYAFLHARDSSPTDAPTASRQDR